MFQKVRAARLKYFSFCLICFILWSCVICMSNHSEPAVTYKQYEVQRPYLSAQMISYTTTHTAMSTTTTTTTTTTQCTTSTNAGTTLIQIKPIQFTTAPRITVPVPVQTTPTEILSPMAIPSIPTSWKAYMDYKCLRKLSTPQYQLQQKCYTDAQGIRRHEEDVCIALGTFYTRSIGERFLITLSNGNSFTAIIADIKADQHTDPTHRYNKRRDGSGSVVEFIVDTYALATHVRKSGSISAYPEYAGDVLSITKIT